MPLMEVSQMAFGNEGLVCDQDRKLGINLACLSRIAGVGGLFPVGRRGDRDGRPCY